jgi:transformer-2 protein
MYDPHTRDSRGFGFVMMDTPEDAEAAINQCSGVNLEGKTISVTHVRFSLQNAG